MPYFDAGRRVKKRPRKTVLNVPDADDEVIPHRPILQHDLFCDDSKPPAADDVSQPGASPTFAKEEEEEEEEEELYRPVQPVSSRSSSKTRGNNNHSEQHQEAIRRTQLLCNAWAQQPSGLTFTQLLQIDMEEDTTIRTPRLSHAQLPDKIQITLNADVFETTKFKLTKDGTYRQVLLTKRQAQALEEATLPESTIVESTTTDVKPPPAPQNDTPKSTSKERDNDEKMEWIEGSISVALPEDAEYLNKVHQWIRQNVEYFSAKRGDRKGIGRGRVGIRCIYCTDTHAVECESFPGTFNGIHTCISQKFVSHFQHCPNLPMEKRNWFLAAIRSADHFKLPSQANPYEGGMTNATYSRVSARRIGLDQIPHDGLRFTRDLTLGALPMETVKVEVEQQQVAAESPKPRAHAKVDTKAESFLAKAIGEEDTENALSKASDKSRCSDYLFLSIRQAIFCHATKPEALKRHRRLGSDRRMTIVTGFAGFACRWCQKKRIFPRASEGITAAILGNLTPHFMNSCDAIPDNLRAAFRSYKPFHAKQHASIQKSLRDGMVADLWYRLRSNDRCVDDDNANASAKGDDAKNGAEESDEAGTEVREESDDSSSD